MSDSLKDDKSGDCTIDAQYGLCSAVKKGSKVARVAVNLFLNRRLMNGESNALSIMLSMCCCKDTIKCGATKRNVGSHIFLQLSQILERCESVN